MRITLSSTVASLLLSAMFALAAHPIRTTPSQDVDEPEPTVLQSSMGTLKHGQRSLHKLIREPLDNRSAILDTLIEMERATVIALGEAPPRLEGSSESELALRQVGYKRALTTLLQQVLTMEQAILESDVEALNAGYAELGRIKTVAHEEYQDL